MAKLIATAPCLEDMQVLKALISKHVRQWHPGSGPPVSAHRSMCSQVVKRDGREMEYHFLLEFTSVLSAQNSGPDVRWGWRRACLTREEQLLQS